MITVEGPDSEGAIMPVNFFIWIVVYPRRADIPAMGAIHRLIRGCPDYCVKSDNGLSKNTTDDEIGTYTVTPPRSEGSVALGSQMLRCAQHDSAVIHTGG
jgi:hypothetical protein